MVVWYTNWRCSYCGFLFQTMKWMTIYPEEPVIQACQRMQGLSIGQIPEPKCSKCGSKWLSCMKEQTSIMSDGILPVFEEQIA